MRIGVAILFAATMFAADGPTFEVASVKPVPAPDPTHPHRSLIRGGPGSSDPTRIVYEGMTLQFLLQRAYRIQQYQITGPAWTATETYDLQATMAEGTDNSAFEKMLQKLLTERFRMTVHRETKEMKGYDLVVAEAGPKLRKSQFTDPSKSGPPPAPGPMAVDANGFAKLNRAGSVVMFRSGPNGAVQKMTTNWQTVSGIAGMLTNQLRTPVEDKTGLTERYDYTLEFAPGSAVGPFGPAPGGALPDVTESGPDITTAVREQLGLKLIPRKVQVEMLVIDNAAKTPLEN